MEGEGRESSEVQRCGGSTHRRRGCKDGERHPGVRRVPRWWVAPVGAGGPQTRRNAHGHRVCQRGSVPGDEGQRVPLHGSCGAGGQKGVQWGATGHSRVQWGSVGSSRAQRGTEGCNGVQWGTAGCNGVQKAAMGCYGAQRYLLGVGVGGGGQDVGNEGTVLDVLVVTHHVDGVLARLRGPVPHVTRAVPLVVTLDLGLRWALDGETWGTVAPLGDVVLQETPRVPGTASPCLCPCPQGDATPYVPMVVTPSPCPCLHCGVPQPVPMSPVWWHLLCAHVPVVVTPSLCPGLCHPICLHVPRVMSPSLCPCPRGDVPQSVPTSPSQCPSA